MCVFALGVAYAAAPTNNSSHATESSKSITAQHDATTWTKVDSLVIAETDSCYIHYHVTGTVTLQPEQKLYVGFKENAGSVVNQKTYEVPEGSNDAMTLTFGNYFLDSLTTATDKTDTVFVMMAVKGTGDGESITVTNVYLTGTIIDEVFGD